MFCLAKTIVISTLGIFIVGCATSANNLTKTSHESELSYLMVGPSDYSGKWSFFGFDIDAAGEFAVTASHRKTIQVIRTSDGSIVSLLKPDSISPPYALGAVAITPDGNTIAAGGEQWGGGEQGRVFLFDRVSGNVISVFKDVSNYIYGLSFSKDGRYLMVNELHDYNIESGLSDNPTHYGLRIFDIGSNKEVFRDENCRHSAFDDAGRLMTMSAEGEARLYDSDFRLQSMRQIEESEGIARFVFSPDGRYIAAPYKKNYRIKVLPGMDLSFSFFVEGPEELQEANDKVDLYPSDTQVEWSADSRWLYAGRGGMDKETVQIFRWDNSGRGPWTVLTRLNGGSVKGFAPLAGGDLIVRAEQNRVFWIGPRGKTQHRIQSLTLASYARELLLSADGKRVSFNFLAYSNGKRDVYSADIHTDGGVKVFSAFSNLASKLIALKKGELHRADRDSLDVSRSLLPRLNGKILVGLGSSEYSVDLAIAPDQQSLVVATNYYLRGYSSDGEPLWARPMHSHPSAMNISKDGRWVVVAQQDGTVRWYDLNNQGEESLTVFINRDLNNWLMWTPEGFFHGTKKGEALIRYQISSDTRDENRFIDGGQLADYFARKDLVSNRLTLQGQKKIEQILAQTNGDIRNVLGTQLPPTIALLSEAKVIQSTPSYALKFKISARSGGIGRVEYRVNDELLVDETSDASSDVGEGVVAKALTLEPGYNAVSVRAYNESNTASSGDKIVRIWFEGH